MELIVDGPLGGTFLGGDSNTYQPVVWDYLLSTFSIKSVVDVGCAEGYNLRYFLNRGLTCTGIEGSSIVAKTQILGDHFILHDYNKSALTLEAKYDLCLSTEFVEHVEEQYMSNYLETFRSAKYLCMTHALPNQHGYHHVNCKDHSYWIDRITSIGFTYDDKTTTKIREIGTTYYKASGMFFHNNAC